MFVGRKNELDSLNRAYQKDTFQFPVMYGRRRVGKTTLINTFYKGKKTVYFVAVQSTAKENLTIMSVQILPFLHQTLRRTHFPRSGKLSTMYLKVQKRNESSLS